MAAQKRGVRTIPQEIITEILCRLPAKSVGRFRCVSKDWLSLLTDPQFIKTHKNNNTLNNQPHLIFQSQPDEGLHSHPFHSGEKVVSTPTKFILESDLVAADDIFFSSSCDGLVLVIFWCEDFRGTLFLVNPTTRENFQLNYEVEAIKYVKVLDAIFIYGFGYDIVTDDYKVVIVTYLYYYASDEEGADTVEALYAYIYSLRNKTWKRVIDPPYYIHSDINGVFVNGFIHWIVSTGHSQVGDDALLVIAAFSLADESFGEVPSPKLCNITEMFESYYSRLVVLCGKLAIFLPKKGEIWLMNEYGVRESWTMVSLHGINKIPIFEPERYGDRPLVLEDNGKILVANSDRMMVYEVENGTFNKTVCVWNPKNFSAVGTYVESLVSLKPNITKQKPTNSREGEENTHQERQTAKRKDIDSSSAPLNIAKLVFSSPRPRDTPRPSCRDTFDSKLIRDRLVFF